MIILMKGKVKDGTLNFEVMEGTIMDFCAEWLNNLLCSMDNSCIYEISIL